MRINFKRASFMGVIITLAMMILVGFTPLKASAAPKLNKKQVELKIGKTCKLKVKGASGKVKWSTSNKKIAKVSKNGVITAKKAGKATIKAKVGKKTLKCKVTVLCRHHQFEEKIIKKATYKRAGEKCKVCKVCGFETEHEEIPKLTRQNEKREEYIRYNPSGYVPRTEGLTEQEIKARLAELKMYYPETKEFYWEGVVCAKGAYYVDFAKGMLFGDSDLGSKAVIEDPSAAQAGDIISVDFTYQDVSGYHRNYMITKVDGDNVYVVANKEGDYKVACWDEEGYPTFKIYNSNGEKYLVFTDQNKYQVATWILRYHD
ncbi:MULTISPECIES: Ig-like domain-containing protein [unclassified Butyrivibrio]|uniref:Ig-like domain-containing protein n=1 Tax=unclassified Butyrivibrio TaxID=2639466 RepID=UPI0004009602|nr:MULTISPECIES: Ig-like domain-containing protein [unclassified Butyrivibrio]